MRSSYSLLARTRSALVPVLLAVALVPAAGRAQAQAGATVRVAVIDVARILQESGRGQAALEALVAFKAEIDDKVATQSKEATELQTRITEGSLSLSGDRLAEMQRELEDKAIALQRLQDDEGRKFAAQRERSLGEIETLVMPLIEELGEELGFTLIFNKFQSGLVFASESVDITDLVLERFDAAHPPHPPVE